MKTFLFQRKRLAVLFSLCALLFLLLSCDENSTSDGKAGSAFVAVSAPFDVAVANERYSERIQAVSFMEEYSVTDYSLTETTPPKASAPNIASSGEITWNPQAADIGVHTFLLRAFINDGSTVEKNITIEVAPRIQLITASAGNEGGEFNSTDGEYSVTVAPNSVASGKSSIDVSYSVVRRANGSEVQSRQVSGIKDESACTFTRPMTAVGPAQPYTYTAPTGAYTELPFIVAFNPFKDAGGGFVHSAESTLYHQNFSLVRKTAKNPRVDLWDATEDHNQTQLRGACATVEECKKVSSSMQGVLFVHGYSMFGGQGGGTGTWGASFDYVKSKGAIPFEFRWRPNSRFEESAYYLSQAIAHINQLTGRKPILVGHSMGGVLISTYLTGLAEKFDSATGLLKRIGYDSPDARNGKISAAGTSIVTVSSPLSGIANLLEATLFGLSPGRDIRDLTITLCPDFTCGESGTLNTKFTYPGSSTFEFSKEALYNAFGVNMYAPGSLVKNLYSAWRNKTTPDIPFDVLVSTWNIPTKFAWVTDEQYGDGLIAVKGMAILPEHLAGSDYDYVKYENRSLTDGEKAKAGIPSNINYTFMFRDDIGFAHSSIHYTMSQLMWYPLFRFTNPNSLAANLPDKGIVSISGKSFDHPLKTALDKAITKAGLEVGVNRTGFSQDAIITGRVFEATAQNGNEPLANAPILVAVYDGSEAIGTMPAATDASGGFSVDYKSILEQRENLNTSNIVIKARIGNNAAYRARTISISPWTSSLNAGQVELVKR